MQSSLHEETEKRTRPLNVPMLAALLIAAYAAAGGYMASLSPAQSADPQPAATAPTSAATAVPEFLPALSENERKVVAELDKPTSFDFVETPLKDVIDYFKAKHQIEIVLDEKALEEGGIGVDVPVTRSLHSVSLRSALSLILRNLEMTFFVDDDVLQLTTQPAAVGILVTRTYPVADLLPDGQFNDLIEPITCTVLPHSWDEVGGNGAISEVTSSSSLVVSQTHQAHDEIVTLLRALREAKKFAGPVRAK